MMTTTADQGRLPFIASVRKSNRRVDPVSDAGRGVLLLPQIQTHNASVEQDRVGLWEKSSRSFTSSEHHHNPKVTRSTPPILPVAGAAAAASRPNTSTSSSSSSFNALSSSSHSNRVYSPGEFSVGSQAQDYPSHYPPYPAVFSSTPVLARPQHRLKTAGPAVETPLLVTQVSAPESPPHFPVLLVEPDDVMKYLKPKRHQKAATAESVDVAFPITGLEAYDFMGERNRNRLLRKRRSHRHRGDDLVSEIGRKSKKKPVDLDQDPDPCPRPKAKAAHLDQESTTCQSEWVSPPVPAQKAKSPVSQNADCEELSKSMSSSSLVDDVTLDSGVTSSPPPASSITDPIVLPVEVTSGASNDAVDEDVFSIFHTGEALLDLSCQNHDQIMVILSHRALQIQQLSFILQEHGWEFTIQRVHEFQKEDIMVELLNLLRGSLYCPQSVQEAKTQALVDLSILLAIKGIVLDLIRSHYDQYVIAALNTIQFMVKRLGKHLRKRKSYNHSSNSEENDPFVECIKLLVGIKSSILPYIIRQGGTACHTAKALTNLIALST